MAKASSAIIVQNLSYDHRLVQDARSLCSGDCVHRVTNYLTTYERLIEACQHEEEPAEALYQQAHEAEVRLRKLVSEIKARNMMNFLRGSQT